jgi:hypothetical protein
MQTYGPNAKVTPVVLELRALERAEGLAKAADVALDAPGLLEMVEVLKEFDPSESRSLARGAQGSAAGARCPRGTRFERSHRGRTSKLEMR